MAQSNVTARTKNYTSIAKRYAQAVVAGKIDACHWAKRACQRQIDDLERAKGGWEYEFVPKKASRICRFVEHTRHVKGRQWAGQRIQLQPWQVFIYTTIFGWVRTGTDLRRFRTVYLEMPRKNAKTTMTAPIGIYMLAGDGESGAEVYSAATTLKQAKIVWEISKEMVDRDSGLRAAFGIETSAHSIYQTATGSRFQALSAEGNSLDGLNASCVIIDELHAHRTRKVYDVLETSKGARQQPLLWCITTAGFDRSGICYEVRTHVTKVLNAVLSDDSFFGMIHTIDDEDDYFDERSWKKANPNYGISVDPIELRNLATKAKSTPSALANFQTKHCSVWTNADVGLFNMVNWAKCGNPDLRLEDFKGQRCRAGIDLAWKNDFSSVVLLFERDGEYYVFARHYLAAVRIDESDNAHFKGWAEEGWIHATQGNVTNYTEIEEDLLELAKEYEIVEVPHDEHQAVQFAQRLQDRGLTMVAMSNTSTALTEPTDKLAALIDEGKIHHNGDPVLAWMLSNVVGKRNRRGFVYPTKERDENKIDGIMALLYALTRALTSPEPTYQAIFL